MNESETNIEIWKDVVGYEGIYQVSTKGRVRSLDRHIPITRNGRPTKPRFCKGVLLKTKENDSGYLIVHLRDAFSDKESWPSVHRLVADAFIVNCDNKPTVNHIDCDKKNNQVSNLEWSSHQEQMLHALSNNRIWVRGNTVYNEQFKEEVKKYYDMHGCSLKQLSKVFGISEKTASKIAKGQWGDKRKLPRDTRNHINEMRQKGMTLEAIAEIVGCHFSTVHKICQEFVE